MIENSVECTTDFIFFIFFFIFVTTIFVDCDIEWPRDELENLFEVQRG